MPRPFLFALLLAAGSAFAAAPSLAEEGGSKRPNVLLILTDDQGWGDIHSHGNEKLDTPNLDRLAADGARFDRFFVSPVCAPTRAAMLTGRYSLRCGVHGVTRAHETMRSEEVTIAELLQGAGYRTACYGKWHNGAHWPEDPIGQGFDEFGGFTAGHWNNYFDPLLPHPPKFAPTREEPAAPDGPRRVEGYIADVFTDAALRFIGERSTAGADGDSVPPWFCYVAYNTPHWPPQASERLYQKYVDRGFEAKDAVAYAMVENIDRNVGRLLAALERWGMEEDTIVLFLTDNGPNAYRFNGGMKGRKGSAHEGGVRVPLFVRWPGRIEPGAVVERNAMHIDLLPTLCDLCDVEPPSDRPLDGVSLKPLLVRGIDADWADRRLFTFKDFNGPPTGRRGAVRTDRWRCVREGRKWELFDMHADPGETIDVGEQFPKIRDELATAFAAKWGEVTADGYTPVPVTVTNDHGLIEFPGHEATLHGDGVSYFAPQGYANDWITNWTDADAFATWPIDVKDRGIYEVSVLYAASAEQAGSTLTVKVIDGADGERDDAISVRTPPLAMRTAAPFPSPDRFTRPEVYERPWGEATLGQVTLPAGQAVLRLSADEAGAGGAPEVKAIRFRPVEDRRTD